MNARIQELAEHCDFYVGNEHSSKPREEQQRLFMEKFAELIVRECAEVADNADATREKWQSISVFIKERFGVK